MNNNQPLRCIRYARTATRFAGEWPDAEIRQLRGVSSKIADLGGQPVRDIVEHGASGLEYSERKGLVSAIRLIEEGQADAIVCYDLSRLARSAELYAAIRQRVEAAGGQLHFAVVPEQKTKLRGF